MKKKLFTLCDIASLMFLLFVLSFSQSISAFFSDSTTKQFFFTTDTGSIPVITEVPNPKTFFITQTPDINLKNYAVAFDDDDGDITDRIVIKPMNLLDKNKAGNYKIEYNVSNRAGWRADPLEINIELWDFVKITSGYYHTLALTSHGKVYTWGYNGYGQLGDGTVTDRTVPQLVEGLNNVKDIAAGVGASFALTSDGQVYSWGRNENGRLGNGTTIGRNKPGLVTMPEGIAFTKISARFATAGGITADGDVYTWGYGGYGAAGTGKTADNFVPTKIDLTNISDFELGYYNGAAVAKDGTLYTWGDNLHGQLGNGAAMVVGTNAPAAVPYFSSQNIQITSASVGFYHMTAVSADGSLFTWGYGYQGRLGNGSTTDKNTPQAIELPETAKKAVAGYYHTGVLTTQGKIYFFGQNAYGKHGSGNTSDHLTPYHLTIVTHATDISLGYDSSFVLSSGQAVYGMGYGGTGVLGTGNNNSSNTPVKWTFSPPAPY